MTKPLLVPSRRRWLCVLWALALALGSLGMSPPAAQANVFDALFGGRQNNPDRATNRRRGGAVRASRVPGGDDSTVPYVITPRRTFHPDATFPITWNPVAGASRYQVRVWQWSEATGGREQMVWETSTAATSIIYPGLPALPPENFYAVEIITDGGVSSDLDAGCAASRFALLFPDLRQQLDAELAALAIDPLASPLQSLAVADTYLKYDMLDYGIATLLLADEATPDPGLKLALGQTYSLAGLNDLARAAYQQAIDLTEESLLLALGYEGLGEVAVVANDLDQALPLLRQALGFYQAAGEFLRADQMAQRIALLETALAQGIDPTPAPAPCPAAR